ncbi:hypothetical protein [Sulfurihydrogenibium yellowstonense]|uniref:Uncharacterized protein n=1 Tax=Sulfurihydrogenibium yellowstonense SS-5 TaxID=432331 RepID=C4FM67_9AQUI|nr:hypothetical protein [Sulfurihydrogenibium yellowstonense]EEP59834.1 hypothetical protein SULYE_1671 [Sulfurihydrogenibium yellowstonense SS-5]
MKKLVATALAVAVVGTSAFAGQNRGVAPATNTVQSQAQAPAEAMKKHEHKHQHKYQKKAEKQNEQKPADNQNNE